MLPLDACAGRVDAGGKAETLARARAAGLRVPDGAVLLPDEPVDEAALAAALQRLGGDRFVVRSSASLEDAATGSGAGLFQTLVGVRAAEVREAIGAVRRSAGSPAVAAYRQARGLGVPAMAVLIQPLVGAEVYGVAHSTDGGFAVEERDPDQPEWGDVRGRVVARDQPGALAAGLVALERLVGGAVDAEFARRGDEVIWLQARPLAGARAAFAAPSFGEPGRWRFDAEHNPDPLSTAHASLVEFVEALGVGRRQRVVGRYLYVETGVPPRGLAPLPLGELRRRFDQEVAPDCARALQAADADGSLDAALAAYAHVYRRYVGELAPSLAQARALAGGDVPLGIGGATLERDQALWELGRGLISLEQYLARFGDHAPSWDVATPTDREQPERVRAFAARLAAGVSPRERVRGVPDSASVLAIAEDDDLLFLRAQATVRRALIRRAVEIALARPDDVFELTLDEARAPSGELSALVARRHHQRRAAARRVPPLAFADGVPEWPLPSARDVLRGTGTRGQARGRAVVVRALADAPAALGDDAVLVVSAIVPSLTPLLAQARALVTDHGGALSHGATLAREYDVPAVLGVGSATALDDGAELYVDADHGRVYVLSARAD